MNRTCPNAVQPSARQVRPCSKRCGSWGNALSADSRSVAILPASDDLRRNFLLGPPFGGKSVGADAARRSLILSTSHEHSLFEQGQVKAPGEIVSPGCQVGTIPGICLLDQGAARCRRDFRIENGRLSPLRSGSQVPGDGLWKQRSWILQRTRHESSFRKPSARQPEAAAP